MNISYFLRFNVWFAIAYFVIVILISVYVASYFDVVEATSDVILMSILYGLLFLLVFVRYDIGKVFFKRQTTMGDISSSYGLTALIIAASVFFIFFVAFASKYFQISYLEEIYFDDSVTFYEIAGSYLTWQNMVIFLFISFLVPIVEELFFRGLIMDVLLKKNSPVSSIFISAMFFGILHGDVTGAFLFGVLLGFIYVRTESLSIPIFIHIANNLFAAVMVAIEEMGILSMEAKIEDLYSANSVAFLISTAVLTVLAYFCVFRSYKGFILKLNTNIEKAII